MAVSFDLFGTLVAVDRPADPATSVARALSERDVSVPADWDAAYREVHRTLPAGRERALDEHVHDALASRDVAASTDVVADAVLDAFTGEGTVRTRDGAVEALESAAANGPVGICSNCSVAGLVDWCLGESALASEDLDAVVTSVDCGWRKPDLRAFEAVATALDVPASDVVHVGDDAGTDGGITALDGTFVDVESTPLATLEDELEGITWD